MVLMRAFVSLSLLFLLCLAKDEVRLYWVWKGLPREGG